MKNIHRATLKNDIIDVVERIVRKIPTIKEYEIVLSFNGKIRQDMPFHTNNFANGVYIGVTFGNYKISNILRMVVREEKPRLTRITPSLLEIDYNWTYGHLLISGENKMLDEFIDEINHRFNIELLENKL